MKTILRSIVVYVLVLAAWLLFVAATMAVINHMRPPQKPVYRVINLGQGTAAQWRV